MRSQLTEADAKAAAVDAVLDTTATSLRTAETALAKSRDSAAQIAAMQQENADLRRELDAALSKCASSLVARHSQSARGIQQCEP